MKSNILIGSMLLCATLSAQAQRINADQPVVNVGQVLFKQPVKAEFILKNKGLKTLRIREVKTSCGCTTVSFPEVVNAGKEFTVSAIYNAQTLGNFYKQVAIYSNASKEPVMLTMKGVVVNEIKDFIGNYAYSLGDLKVDVNEVEFDDVNRGDQPSMKIHIFNNSNEIAQPVFMHLPNYLTAEVSPSRIAPHHSGTATLSLDSRKLRDFGLTQTNVYLGFAPGDKVSEQKQIQVSTILLPAFQQMTPQQITNAPKLKLSTDSLNLGNFNGRKRIKGEIELTNTGHSTLEVRNLQMFSNGLEIALNKTKIAPNGQAKLKITAVRDQIKETNRALRILMITNDPDKGKVVIKIHVK